MPLPIEVLTREVLGLSAADRSKLLDRLVESLDADAARDAAWSALAARRDADADADPSRLVPVDEALARLRAGVA